MTKSLFILTAVLALTARAEEYNYSEEMKTIRNEIEKIDQEIEKEEKEEAADKENYATYKQKIEKNLASIRVETDSIQAEILLSAHYNDSLRSVILSLEASRKEIEARDTYLKKNLLAMGKKIEAQCVQLPPSLEKVLINRIQFLLKELQENECTTVDAISRLAKIVTQMRETTMEIQVQQGNSPIPDIEGQVFILRIGTVFEAIVNHNGEKCAVWSGSGKDKWVILNDRETAAELLDAVKIREGKAIPKLVTLPLNRRG